MNDTKLKILALFLFSFVLISGTIDLTTLFNYSGSNIPNNIDEDIDSSPLNNQMDDKVATLGRVLFYDKKLSVNNSVSCASCHKQELAFGLEELQGTGANGLSIRRPMRLLNLRIYSTPFKGLFWDERSNGLENLVTQPIKDHIEMGYSGAEEDSPDFDDLIAELEDVDYYNELFTFAFGDNSITEERISKALSQFLRSIESYDSKFDEGFAMVNGTPTGENIELDFPNFTEDENTGKMLFSTDAIKDIDGARIGGGLGCFHCHTVPTFTFAPESGNNGIITEIEGGEVFNITKSPSLRDIFGPSGALNGPLFHNGQAATFNEVLDHYNDISPTMIMLDHRMDENGTPLNLTAEERLQVEAFIKTLTGSDIYTNEKWSNPFDSNEEIEIIGGTLSSLFALENGNSVKIYPNPAQNFITVDGINSRTYYGEINSMTGQKVWQGKLYTNQGIDISAFSKGIYSLSLWNASNKPMIKSKFIKL